MVAITTESRVATTAIGVCVQGTTVNVVSIQGEWLMIKSKHGKMPGFIRKAALIP